MGKLASIVLTICLFFSSPGYSDQNSDINVKSTLAPSANVLTQTSDKKYFISYKPPGVGPAISSGAGFLGGYFINPETLILFEVLSGQARGTTTVRPPSQGEVENVWNAHTSSRGIHIQNFLRNAYWKIGIEQKRIEYKSVYRSGSPSEYGYGFTGDSWVLSSAIGDSWEFGNFTIGCDWFGPFWPLSHSISDEYTYGPYTSQMTADQDQDKAINVVNNGMQFLRFYVGFVF